MNSDSHLLAAGKDQGLIIHKSSYREARNEAFFEIERKFYADISSGTQHDLITRLRREIAAQINKNGAVIDGKAFSGVGGDDLRDFSYTYTWRHNDGIVRVYSFACSNTVEMILLSREHRQQKIGL